MPEYVRVKDKDTGHKLTVLAQEAEANADAYQVLKQDAVDHNGDPLAPEFSESTATGAKAATEKKEN